MAYSSSRLPTMETCRVRITKKPKSAASLHRKPTSAEDAGCLASVAYRHVISCSYVTRHLVNNIVEALKQNNRVCKIHVRNIRTLLSKALSEMKKPFPALTVHRRRCFQIRSWWICPTSPISPIHWHLHFRHYRNFFRLLATLSGLTFAIFRINILGTFHLTRWLLPYPCCQGSKNTIFYSSRPNLGPTKQANAQLGSYMLFSLFFPHLAS